MGGHETRKAALRQPQDEIKQPAALLKGQPPKLRDCRCAIHEHSPRECARLRQYRAKIVFVSAGEDSGPAADRGVSKAKSDIVLSPLF